jgi:hypothetical protein
MVFGVPRHLTFLVTMSARTRLRILYPKGTSSGFYLVPEEGLEPSRGCPHRILSPARLPFHHSGTKSYY